MVIRVKKITKYSKYFLLLAVASLASLVLIERNRGSLSDASRSGIVPVVYADHPASGDGGADGAGGADCDGADGDCE